MATNNNDNTLTSLQNLGGTGFYPGGHGTTARPAIASGGSDAQAQLMALHRSLDARTIPTGKDGWALTPTPAEIRTAQLCGCDRCRAWLMGVAQGSGRGFKLAQQQPKQQLSPMAGQLRPNGGPPPTVPGPLPIPPATPRRAAVPKASAARRTTTLMPDVVRRGGRAAPTTAPAPKPTYRLATALSTLDLATERDRQKARAVISRIVSQHVSERMEPRPREDSRVFIARRQRAIGRGELNARRAFGL